MTTPTAPSLADVVRRQWARIARESSDAEICLRYYRSLWHCFKASAFGLDAGTLGIERQHLWRRCVASLAGCRVGADGDRVTLDEARHLAEAAFGDAAAFRAALRTVGGPAHA